MYSFAEVYTGIAKSAFQLLQVNYVVIHVIIIIPICYNYNMSSIFFQIAKHLSSSTSSIVSVFKRSELGSFFYLY